MTPVVQVPTFRLSISSDGRFCFTGALSGFPGGAGMTIGKYTRGGGANDDFYSSKSWNGADDPAKKRENSYSCVATSYTRTKTTRFYQGVLYDQIYFFSATNWYPWEGSGWDSNDELALLSKLNEKIRGHDFNAAVAAAELPEALASVKSLATSVLLAYRYTRYGRYDLALRALGQFSRERVSAMKKLHSTDISGAWLSMQYGWLPLIKDIYAAMQAVEVLTAQPRDVVFRETKKKVFKNYNVSSSPPSYTILADGYFIRSYKVVLKERVSLARSLGLLNPAAVVWEKVPYSFVVDWFIPIGNYLDNVGFWTGLDGTYVATSHGRAASSKVKPLYKPPAGWVYVWGDYRYQSSRTVRTVTTGVKVPLPSWKSLDKALSLGHLKNAAALIWQRIAHARS